MINQKKSLPGSGKITFITVIVSMLIMANPLKGAQYTGITIDHQNRQLVAPEGTRYHWYYNGKLIDFREQKIHVEKSGNYRVEIIDENGAKSSEAIDVIVIADGIRRIFIIGDSTVQTYNQSYYPMMGWGQVLNLFFDESKIQIINKAIGGRSSRSFWEEGRWTEVVNLLDSNDYVFIQFGHNDRDWSKPERYTDTAAYKEYLRIYVNESREKGATPVLVSPMIMNAWEGSTLRNVFTEGENNYRGAMLEVAKELDALFVDLNMKSYELVKELGAEYASYFLHMGLEPGEYPNYPDGSTDVGTHYQEMGALEMAKLIIEGLIELEEDSTVSYLTNALTPTTKVSTELYYPGTGLVTRPGSYPIGSHVTLKTRLPYFNAFNHWEDTLGNTISSSNILMLTLADSNYFYKAIVNDCNGETGGEATQDKCYLCSGGSTNYPPCEVIFESENACSFTGSKSFSYIGPVRRRVVNTLSAENSPSIEYSIQAAVAGTYDFVFIYLSKISGEQLNISVNDIEKLSAIDLVQAEDWSEVRFQLDLDEGVNFIRLSSSASEGGILFDMLAAYSTNLSAGDCEDATVIFNKNYSNHSAYPNPFTGAITLKQDGRFEYHIYNTLGMEMLKGYAENICSTGYRLPKGIYILEIIPKSGNTTQLIYKY